MSKRGAAIVIAVATVTMAPSPASAIKFATASEQATAEFGAAPIAECPDGQRVLGGGVASSQGFGASDVEGLTGMKLPSDPFYDSWRAVATGFEDTTITTFAACRAGPVARRHKSFDVDAGERATRQVSCPRGYRATGGGVTSPERSEVKSSRPVEGGRAWEGSLLNVEDFGTDWGVEAFCVDGAFADHLVYEHDSDEVGTGEEVGLATDCPGHGGLVGGGAYIGPGGSNLNTSAPVEKEAWHTLVDHTSIGPDLTFRNYAICHRPHAEPTGTPGTRR